MLLIYQTDSGIILILFLVLELKNIANNYCKHDVGFPDRICAKLSRMYSMSSEQSRRECFPKRHAENLQSHSRSLSFTAGTAFLKLMQLSDSVFKTAQNQYLE